MSDSTSTPTVDKVSSNVFYRNLARDPLYAVRGEGNYVYLKDGHKLLDCGGNNACTSVGYGDKRVLDGIFDQLQTLPYVSSGMFTHKAAEDLADELIKDSNMKRALFVCDGSEATESAIKLARQYHVENHQPQRVNFIARLQSYHGTTLGALALCNQKTRRAPYLPLFSPCFHHVSPCFAYRYKLNDESDEAYVKRLADELEAKFQELGPDTVAAFFAETIVGSTIGSTTAVPGYFKAMREVCNRHGALLVLDEILCGMGRSGKMHAWEWEDLSSPPDIQLNGKAFGGGYGALSAVLVSTKVIDVLAAGSGTFINGFTHQAHPVGCRAALEVLKVIKQDRLIEQCHQRGLFLEKALKTQLGNHPHVGDIRGRGLFWSIELVKNKETKEMYPSSFSFVDLISKDCAKRGVALYPSMKGTFDGTIGDHITAAPPFTITEEELLFLVDTIKVSIDAILKPNSELV